MRKTTWTDDEIKLLKKMHGTVSNRDLCSEYFPSKSESQIKWQIERLGLGKSYNWEEWEIELLKELKQLGIPDRLIADAVRRPRNAVTQKAHKLGIKSPRRADADDEDLIEKQNLYSKIDSKLIGTINEDSIRIALSLNGFDVFLPYMNNHKTDLIVIKGNKLAKIQIKSAVYDKDNKRFRSLLRTKDKSGNHIGYDSIDVDFFIVKCNGIEEFYVIPYDIGDTYSSVNLYPHRPKLNMSGVSYEEYRNAFNLIMNFLED